MRSLVLRFAIAGAMSFGPSYASAGDTCQSLTRTYDLGNREIANIDADRLSDTGAAESQTMLLLREMQTISALQKQAQVLTAMQMRSCPAPDVALGAAAYIKDSLACGTAKLKGGAMPAECNVLNWSPLESGASIKAQR